jgi:hypothetical protein
MLSAVSQEKLGVRDSYDVIVVGARVAGSTQ